MNTNPESTQALEIETEINTDLNDDDLEKVTGGGLHPLGDRVVIELG